jgi:hypothetical protein
VEPFAYRNRSVWRIWTYDGYRCCDLCHRPAGPDPGGHCRGGIARVCNPFLARPKLAISADRLAIRGPLRTQGLGRPDIKLIRITEFRRLARKVRLLEIDTVDDRLFVLTRWDLGTDPLEVLDALTAAGFAGR